MSWPLPDHTGTDHPTESSPWEATIPIRVSSPRYVIVSPVKDEAQYITHTIESVIAQTVKPKAWVIVDDGSTDDTVEIVKQYAEQIPWIKLVESGNKGRRNTGSAESIAFKFGYELVKGLDFDYLVKLDGDVSFDEHYFEMVFEEFEADLKLGIASGAYLENRKQMWKVVRMPTYHTAGASKVVRRSCFEAIGGFITVPGWDTVDEIRAWAHGWTTKHFGSIRFFHLKNEGSGMGRIRTAMMHGEICYMTGGSSLFLSMKVLHRIVSARPFLLAGLSVLFGYLKCAASRKELLVTKEEKKHYRNMLNSRLSGTIFSRLGRKSEASLEA